MISRYREIENSYIENFSKREDRGNNILFWDEELPDMHAFNCVLVKESIDRDLIGDFVANILKQAKQDGRDFLTIILHPEIEVTGSLKEYFLSMGFELRTNLYMKIDGDKADAFRGNEECVVKIAGTEDEYEAGRALDIETCTAAGVPQEFAVRKTLRKKEVFQNRDKRLCSYLCFYENSVIGKCELHIKDDYAKIEDFEVLDKYQRRGFGTAILKQVISYAAGRGIKNIYLITDKDDTPKEMYGKLGFEIIGEELELFWSR